MIWLIRISAFIYWYLYLVRQLGFISYHFGLPITAVEVNLRSRILYFFVNSSLAFRFFLQWYLHPRPEEAIDVHCFWVSALSMCLSSTAVVYSLADLFVVWMFSIPVVSLFFRTGQIEVYFFSIDSYPIFLLGYLLLTSAVFTDKTQGPNQDLTFWAINLVNNQFYRVYQGNKECLSVTRSNIFSHLKICGFKQKVPCSL